MSITPDQREAVERVIEALAEPMDAPMANWAIVVLREAFPTPSGSTLTITVAPGTQPRILQAVKAVRAISSSHYDLKEAVDMLSPLRNHYPVTIEEHDSRCMKWMVEELTVLGFNCEVG